MVRWSLAVLTAVAAVMLLGATAAAGGGCHAQDTTTSEARGTSIDIKSCKFAPVVLFAPAGTTVRWTQSDVVPHNIVGLGWGETNYFMSGSSYEHAFTQAGIYPYHCSLHPDMSGVVIVGDVDLKGANAPVAAAPEQAPVVASTPTPVPSPLVASALTARAGPEPGLVGAGLAALAITAGLGFAIGRRKRATS